MGLRETQRFCSEFFSKLVDCYERRRDLDEDMIASLATLMTKEEELWSRVAFLVGEKMPKGERKYIVACLCFPAMLRQAIQLTEGCTIGRSRFSGKLFMRHDGATPLYATISS